MKNKVKIEVKGDIIRLEFPDEEMFHINAWEIRKMKHKLRKLFDLSLKMKEILSE